MSRPPCRYARDQNSLQESRSLACYEDGWKMDMVNRVEPPKKIEKELESEVMEKETGRGKVARSVEKDREAIESAGKVTMMTLCMEEEAETKRDIGWSATCEQRREEELVAAGEPWIPRISAKLSSLKRSEPPKPTNPHELGGLLPPTQPPEPPKPPDLKVVTTMAVDVLARMVSAEQSAISNGVRRNTEEVGAFHIAGQYFDLLGQAHMCKEKLWCSEKENQQTMELLSPTSNPMGQNRINKVNCGKVAFRIYSLEQMGQAQFVKEVNEDLLNALFRKVLATCDIDYQQRQGRGRYPWYLAVKDVTNGERKVTARPDSAKFYLILYGRWVVSGGLEGGLKVSSLGLIKRIVVIAWRGDSLSIGEHLYVGISVVHQLELSGKQPSSTGSGAFIGNFLPITKGPF